MKKYGALHLALLILVANVLGLLFSGCRDKSPKPVPSPTCVHRPSGLDCNLKIGNQPGEGK